MANKIERLPSVRVSPRDLGTIKAGAKKAGISMSQFLVGSALDRAASVGVKGTARHHPRQMSMI